MKGKVGFQVEKKIRENYGRRLLMDLFKDKYQGAKLSDRPDIICPPKVGCEVTSSLSSTVHEYAATKEGDFSDLVGKIQEEDLKKSLKQWRRQKAKEEEDIHNYKRIYLQKLTNLNSPDYQRFPENNLLIFSWIYSEEILMDFLVFLDEEKEEGILFDHIYIFFYGAVLERNRETGKIQIHPLKNKKVDGLFQKATWEVQVKTFLGIW